MRKFLQMSSTEFGKKLAVSHATIVKWEKEQTKINPLQESYIRMFLFEHLQNNELLSLYQEIRPEKLAESKHEKQVPFPVDINQLRAAI